MIDGPPLFRQRLGVRGLNGPALPVPAGGRRMWLITFTDLVALMLAFFVMLFAMSGVEVELWDATAQSLSRTRDPAPAPPPPPPVAARNVPTAVRVPALDLDYLAMLLRRVTQDSPELAEARLARVPDGLILVLDPGDVFDGDEVRLAPAAARTVAAVGAILGNFGNRIGVRFRADPVAALQDKGESGWERALVRAAALANALRAAGYEREIIAYGLTGGGLHPPTDRSGQAADGQAADGRLGQLEILILAEAVARP